MEFNSINQFMETYSKVCKYLSKISPKIIEPYDDEEQDYDDEEPNLELLKMPYLLVAPVINRQGEQGGLTSVNKEADIDMTALPQSPCTYKEFINMRDLCMNEFNDAVLKYPNDIVLAIVNEYFIFPSLYIYTSGFFPTQNQLVRAGLFDMAEMMEEVTRLESWWKSLNKAGVLDAYRDSLPKNVTPVEAVVVDYRFKNILEKGVAAGLLDERYQPIKAVPRTTIGMSKGQMKLFAQLAGKELNLSTPWKTFENLWSVKHLQSADIYDMSQERITVVKKLFGAAK